MPISACDSCVADGASGGYHPHSKVGRNCSELLRGFEVVGICDPLKPLRRSVRVCYLNCDMPETLVRCPTEPVFDIRIDEDGIASDELPCGTPQLLAESRPSRDDEYLPSPRFDSVRCANRGGRMARMCPLPPRLETSPMGSDNSGRRSTPRRQCWTPRRGLVTSSAAGFRGLQDGGYGGALPSAASWKCHRISPPPDAISTTERGAE